MLNKKVEVVSDMTIREIAKLIGVSPATVSLVLNNKPGVRAERRKEIQTVLINNGYTIRACNESPVQKKQIYLIKDRSHYENDKLTVSIIDTIEKHAHQAGYITSILNIDEFSYEQKLSSLNYDDIQGIIFFFMDITADCLNYTLRMPVPRVYVDFFSEYYFVNTVDADQRMIAHLAAQHLINLGHRKIGYLRAAPSIGYLSQRYSYFQTAVSKLGVQIIPDFIANINPFADNTDEILRSLFSSAPELPTAIFAEIDSIAASAIRVLTNMGFSIPEDISVLAVDNTEICSLTSPKLTSIDANTHEMGRLAFERLSALIQDPSRPVLHSYVAPFLVRRDSTGPAKE